MMERAFRLDFFVAIAALVVSVLSTLTLIYQTHVIGQQYASTIWPYLSMTGTYDLHGEKFSVTNDGVGPALIESAQLEIDGKPVPDWNAYFKAMMDQPAIRNFFVTAERQARAGRLPTGAELIFSSIGPGSTIRPGDSEHLLTLEFPASVPLPQIIAHKLTLNFCYCSLNGNCWTLHSELQNPKAHMHPASVASCTTSWSIEAPTVQQVRGK